MRPLTEPLKWKKIREGNYVLEERDLVIAVNFRDPKTYLLTLGSSKTQCYIEYRVQKDRLYVLGNPAPYCLPKHEIMLKAAGLPERGRMCLEFLLLKLARYKG